MRSPLASASLMSSRMCLTANSTSLAGKCFWLRAIDSINSDFVMGTDLPPGLLHVFPSTSTKSFRSQLLLEQVSEPRSGRGPTRVALVVLNCLRLFVRFLGLDRQRDDPVLAVDAREFRLDGVADLEHGARVLHAIARDLGSAELAQDAAVERHRRHLRVDLLDRAFHDAALWMVREEQRQRVLVELFDSERDALALRIDREHRRLELLALLVVAHGLFAGDVPR